MSLLPTILCIFLRTISGASVLRSIEYKSASKDLLTASNLIFFPTKEKILYIDVLSLKDEPLDYMQAIGKICGIFVGLMHTEQVLFVGWEDF